MLRVCKECGQTFETKSSRAMWCDAEHHRFCPICGKDFIVPRDKLRGKISLFLEINFENRVHSVQLLV